LLGSAGGVDLHRRKVAGVGVTEGAGFGVEDAVEERDELVGGKVAAEDFVHAGANPGDGLTSLSGLPPTPNEKSTT
jgi:hypothetical protein